MKNITPTENAIYSIIIVAILLWSAFLQVHQVTITAIFMMVYLKRQVIKFSKESTYFDRFNFYAYFVCGILYSIMYVFDVFTK